MRKIALNTFGILLMTVVCQYGVRSFALPTAPPGSTGVLIKSTFKGSLGEEFNYASPVTVDYNPHGGADRAIFNWEGASFGAMFVIGLPPESEKAIPPEAKKRIWNDVITKDIEKKTRARTVIHTELDNASGCHFDLYQATVERKGVRYKYALYLFLNTQKYANPAQEMLREKFGGYKIEFMVPEAKHETMLPYLEEIISTFKRPADRGP